MDFDFELLLYIVFVLIAILSRAFKKKRPQAPRPEADDTGEEGKTITFEDLLKEFQQKSAPSEPEPARETYTPVEKVEEEVEYIEGNDDEIQKIYEESIRKAERAKEESRKNRPVFEHFEAFEAEVKENQLAKEVREMLIKPDSAAKAIILSEIINRKY